MSHLQTRTLLKEFSVVAIDVLLPQKAKAGKFLEICLQG